MPQSLGPGRQEISRPGRCKKHGSKNGTNAKKTVCLLGRECAGPSLRRPKHHLPRRVSLQKIRTHHLVGYAPRNLQRSGSACSDETPESARLGAMPQARHDFGGNVFRHPALRPPSFAGNRFSGNLRFALRRCSSALRRFRMVRGNTAGKSFPDCGSETARCRRAARIRSTARVKTSHTRRAGRTTTARCNVVSSKCLSAAIV